MIWIIEALLLFTLTSIYTFSSNDLEKKYIEPFSSKESDEHNISKEQSLHQILNQKISTKSVLNAISIDTEHLKVDFTQLLDGCLHIKYLNLETITATNISDILGSIKNATSTSAIDVSILVDKLSLSLGEIEYEGILFDPTDITLEGIQINSDGVSISHMQMHSKHIDFMTLNLVDINFSIDAVKLENTLLSSGNMEASLFYQDSNGSHRVSANGSIEDNKLYFSANMSSDVLTQYLPTVMSKQAYDDLYAIFILDIEGIHGDISSGGTQLFTNDALKKYFVNAPWIQTHLDLDFKNPKLHLDSIVHLNSTLGDFDLTHKFVLGKELYFDGELSSHNFNIELYDDSFNREFFKDITITYAFRDLKLDLHFEKEGVDINVTSDDYQYYDSDLTVNNMAIDRLLNIDMQKPIDLNAKFRTDINTLLTDGNYLLELNSICLFDGSLKESFMSEGVVSCYRSLLPQEMNHDQIFPLKYNITKSETVNISIESSDLFANLLYDSNSKETELTLGISDYNFSVAGTYDETLNLEGDLSIGSCQKFQTKIKKYHKFDLLNLDCNLSTSLKINGPLNDPNLNSKFYMSNIKYRDKNDLTTIDTLDVSLSYYKKNFIIDYYNIQTPEDLFFTHEPSNIEIKDHKIILSNFSLYDSNISSGWYDYRNSTAQFDIKSSDFNYSSDAVNMLVDLDLRATYDSFSLLVSGNAQIQKALINYDYKQQVDPLDEDIVIVQEANNVSWMQKFLKLDINITNDEPLIYHNDNMEVAFDTDLNIKKRLQEEIRPIGTLWLTRGYYDGFGRTFRLQPSEIILSDEKTLNPYLNIYAEVKTKEAQIYVNLVGRMSDPDAYFSSSPAMSETDILSLILFDSTTESLTSADQDGDLNYSLLSMSTIFSEDFANRMGMKINRLNMIRTQDGKTGFEVGARINSRISIGYIVDANSRGRVQYDLTDNIAFDVETGENYSVIDLIFHMQY